jgi:hypothetical protein
MRRLGSVPVRWLAAVSAALLGSYLDLAAHYRVVAQENPYGWGAPPPPAESFFAAVLEVPGSLAGSPVIALGLFLDREWITMAGLILGATFFWYCVGWYFDVAQNLSDNERPPKIVQMHLSALVYLSAALFPFGCFACYNVGHHFCAVGVPPLWSELLTYGIVMSWLTLGTFFAWRRFQLRRENRHQPRTLLDLRLHG